MENEIIKPILPAPGEEEIWVECEDYPAYEISTFGNSRNKKTKRLMNPKYNNSGGYAQLHFRIGVDGPNGKYVAVHRLVAKAFIPNDSPQRQLVDHKDRNRRNNYYKNLRWATPQENSDNSTKQKSKYIYKKSTPLVLLHPETKELIEEFSSPNEAAEKLQMSAQVIVDSIHSYRPCLKVGIFMTKEAYEKEQPIEKIA
jgi:hypothetical protein